MDLRLKLHCKRLGRGGHKKRGKKSQKTRQSKKNSLSGFSSIIASDKHLHLHYLLMGSIYWKITMQHWAGNREVLLLWNRVFMSSFGVVSVAVTNLHICFYKVSPISENYFMLPCYYTNKMKSKFLHDVTCKPFVLK